MIVFAGSKKCSKLIVLEQGTSSFCIIGEMGESQKKKSAYAIVITLNMAAMSAGTAANKSNAASSDAGRIERSISELNDKFDRISEQLTSMHPEVREVELRIRQ